MNANSMCSEAPLQPDNPSDSDRHYLGRIALAQRGRSEDFENVIRLMAPPPDIINFACPGRFKGIRVGIIGAGLAGLAAAFELRKLGCDITIFEAREDRIGGRVYTYYFDQAGTLYGELGPMRIPATHETTWHYINLFKLPTRTFVQVNENAIIYLRGAHARNDPEGRNVMRYIYPRYNLTPRERNAKWQELNYYGLESPILKAPPDVRSEILQVKPSYHLHTLYWDGASNRQIMEQSGLSQDAISLISSFSPLAGQNLQNSFIDYVQENYPADLSYLYEIPGGLSRLPYAFYNSLNNKTPVNDYPGIPPYLLGKVTARIGNWVTGIYLEEGGRKVRLAYMGNGFQRPLSEMFDYIICAIPFSTLRTIEIKPLFGSIKMQAIKDVNYTPSQKTILLCRHRFWEKGGPGRQIIGGGSYTDLPLTTVWYPSDHAKYCLGKVRHIPWGLPSHSLSLNTGRTADPAGEPGVLTASYNYNLDTTRLDSLPDKLQYDEVSRELEELHGLPKGYINTVAAGFYTHNWNDDPWTRGALCFFTPEQKRLFSYAMAVPEYGNRVFFAGEHISAVHRWMQGALQTGMKAANDLAAACGSLL